VALGGGSFAHAPLVPLLLIHGDMDTAVAIAYSQEAFTRLSGPRYFVTLHGSDHDSIFVPPASTVLNESVIDFLNATLKGDAKAIKTMQRQVDQSNNATIRSAT
jgi:alpha-beta hydrolase superfamily lysophospholipase